MKALLWGERVLLSLKQIHYKVFLKWLDTFPGGFIQLGEQETLEFLMLPDVMSEFTLKEQTAVIGSLKLLITLWIHSGNQVGCFSRFAKNGLWSEQESLGLMQLFLFLFLKSVI